MKCMLGSSSDGKRNPIKKCGKITILDCKGAL